MLMALLGYATTVDRVLYAVEDRVVTQSDVAFDLDLDPYDACPIVALDHAAYPHEQRVLDLTVVRALAGDTVIYRPSASEVETRWITVRDSFPTIGDYAGFLKRWGLSDDDLRGLLYSRLVTERYIRRVAGTGDIPLESPEFIPLYQAWITEVREGVLIRRPTGGAW